MDAPLDSPGHSPVFIAIIGPPASGKSTLAMRLADAFGAIIIRPRDAIRAALAHEPGLHRMFIPINEMGWVADGALGVAVRTAVARVPSTCRTVVLENLPGDMTQVADVYLASKAREAKLVILRLDADEEVLLRRGIARRVCQSCERDDVADPHEPAASSNADPSLCARCAFPLATRPDDSQSVLTDRTKRHHQYALGVLELADALDIPIIQIDATSNISDVAARAIEAVAALVVPLPRGQDGVSSHRSTP